MLIKNEKIKSLINLFIIITTNTIKTDKPNMSETCVIFDHDGQINDEAFDSILLKQCFPLFNDLLTEFPNDSIVVEAMSLATFQSILDICVGILNEENPEFPILNETDRKACEFLMGNLKSVKLT